MSDKSVLPITARAGGVNSQLALVDSVLNKTCVATLVKIVAVATPENNGMVGAVDVQPLVNQVDGDGNAIPHGVIFGLGYFRAQGGLNAIILDPEVGDIGLAVFAHNDISTVKSTRSQANPGSYRRNDWSDGIYVGGLLNSTPTQYVKFGTDGITLMSPTKVTIHAPETDIIGKTVHTGQVWMNGKQVDETHLHTNVQPGSGISGDVF